MSNTRILVVDNKPDHRAIVQRWLENDGYEVHSAVNGCYEYHHPRPGNRCSFSGYPTTLINRFCD